MWNKFEPVRSYVYTVLVVLSGLLVARGVVSGEEVNYWIALAGAVLGVPAVEIARKRVTPATKLLPRTTSTDGGQYPQ